MPRWSLVTGRAGAGGEGAATSSGGVGAATSSVPAAEDPLTEISPGVRITASSSGGGDTSAAGDGVCEADWPPGGWTDADPITEGGRETSP